MPRPVLEPLGPLLELRLAVIPTPPARARVEAHEREVCGQLVRLERVHLRAIADHERDTVLAQQRIDVGVEPARVAKLEAMALLLRQALEGGREPPVVALEVRRQLPEDRAELRRAEQRLDARVEAVEPRPEFVEPLDVRQVARRLDREGESRWRLLHPARHRRAPGEPVESRFHLHGVEELRVVLEPFRRGEARRVEDAVAPVGVVPARATYPDRPLTTRRHSSSVPAAAMRERDTRSSGASANSASPSAFAIESPRSSTSS